MERKILPPSAADVPDEKIANVPGDGRQQRRRRKVRRRWRLRERFVFTDNRHPSSGILSTVLGVLAVAGVCAAVVRTYRGGGAADGPTVLGLVLCVIYAAAGLVLGIYARFRKNVFLLFPKLGIGLNLAALALLTGLSLLGR